jgi:hypothetical protein
MSPSPPELLALACATCGMPLEVRQEAEVFPCRSCGRAYEATEAGLQERSVSVAIVTTAYPEPERTRYLGAWRFPAAATVTAKQSPRVTLADAVWRSLQAAAGPDRVVSLYVPAFVLSRVLVQQLGVALVEAQPRLTFTQGVPRERAEHAKGAGDAGALHAGGAEPEAWLDPGFGTVSPIVLSETDARAVAHFVYLAVESTATPDLRGIDYELELGPGELLLLPAVYDPRYVRGSNWRLLLREFDGLVA